MSNLKLPNVTDHASAVRELDGERSKQIGYQTWLRRNSDIENTISVVHHTTDIIDYYPDGGIALNTGGWDTSTTSSRMHRLTPCSVRVFIRKGVTMVETPDRKAEPVMYGIVLSHHEIAMSWDEATADA